MSLWFSKNLSDAILAWEPLGRIESLFLSEYARAGRPSDMAVFMRHESAGRLHCEVIVYLPPSAATIARAINAAPCRRPSPDGLSLLAGAEESWSTLFPDRMP